MTGQLQLVGGGEPDARCVHCGVMAVGPCARCHVPLCGDCCVIVDEGAKPWAICRDCEADGPEVSSGWSALLVDLGKVIGLLLLAVVLLYWLAG